MSTHDRALRGIVVTGASGGLGQALVMNYAAPDVHFLLLGRDRAGLEDLATRAREVGAKVACLSSSGNEHVVIANTIHKFDEKIPIDLLICAAGTKTNNTDGIEDFSRFQNVIDTNLTFPAFVSQCVLTGMRERNRGQIAMISSLAAIAPLPDIISYSASKAGLNAYAVALRRSLGSTNIGVTLVCPGFIDTPMTANHIGPTPLCISPQTAARLIRRALDRRSPYVSFPKVLIVLTWFWNLMPTRFADWISGFLRARIIDPDIG